jgi:uncharacterized OsmC-like protein
MIRRAFVKNSSLLALSVGVVGCHSSSQQHVRTDDSIAKNTLDSVLVSHGLGQHFEEMKQQIVSKGKAAALATNKAEVKLIKDQHSEATVRGFTLTQDEPTSAWGTGKGPTPIDYFITSVGFCENVVFVRNAAMAKVSIDSLETIVTGSWDRRGLFDIEGTSSRIQSITVETRISTTDSVERVAEVVKETHRRCPVHATLSRATEMIFKLVVNGQNVPL